jgi:CRISPR-associated protein Cmr6
MTLPLYKELQQNYPSVFTGASVNAGLVFERFFSAYDRECRTVSDQKSDWLQRFNAAVGDPAALSRHVESHRRLVEKLGGKMGVFTTTYRLVTGIGYPHPVENGLCWHPVWGTPYLSGASVKGLIRAWLEGWEPHGEEEKRQRLLRWFGSTDKDPTTDDYTAQAGNIIYFDAIPTRPVKLVTDIMTPHMGDWYARGGQIADAAKEPERLPADWHDPVPIPFLVIKEASYLFSLAPRNASVCLQEDLDSIFTYLQLALEWLGAGAKTSTGYGQLAPDDGDPAVAQNASPAQKVKKTIDAWPESTIAKKFGRDYNKTKKEIYRLFGAEGWTQAVTHLWASKNQLIDRWKTSGKNTIEKKAYKKLKSTVEEMSRLRDPARSGDDRSE